MQGLPHAIARLGELRRAAHDAEVGARTRQRHGHDLLHAAVLDHHDAVGDQHGLVEIVGDEQDGLLGARVDVEQLGLHGLARLRVERAERLVHQQHLGVDRERARDADALLHAAGELVRAAVERVLEADEIEIAARGVAQLAAAHALHFEAEHHVPHAR